jgi:hypothetical protein
MRVRTAVGITVAIVSAQVAVAWLAADAWRAIPQGRWPPARWHIELGSLSDALAAFAGTGAALIALWIAGRDRRDRFMERREEEQSVARLVRLDVHTSMIARLQGGDNCPVATVRVRNFGPLPVLDVTVTEAQWTEHPEARCPVTPRGRGMVNRKQAILRPWQPDQKIEESIEFDVEFLHPTEDVTVVPKAEQQTPRGTLIRYMDVDLTKVIVKVRFTTANGLRWEATTDGAATGETVRV